MLYILPPFPSDLFSELDDPFESQKPGKYIFFFCMFFMHLFIYLSGSEEKNRVNAIVRMTTNVRIQGLTIFQFDKNYYSVGASYHCWKLI